MSTNTRTHITMRRIRPTLYAVGLLATLALWNVWNAALAMLPANTPEETLKPHYVPIYVPMAVGSIADWRPVASVEDLPDLRSIGVCEDNLLLAGTDTGLMLKKSNGWESIEGIGGPIFDIQIADDCKEAHLATYGNGVWKIEKLGEDAPIIARLGGANSVPQSRRLVWRDNDLFVGTDEGVFIYDDDKWQPVGDTGEVTDLTLQGGGARLYAAVYSEGIRHNDSCDVLLPSNCSWEPLSPPSDDNLAFKILGYKDAAKERLLLGTIKGLYRHDSSTWVKVQSPAGTVFSLGQTTDGALAFAGVQLKGPWQTADDGVTWTQIGSALQSDTIVDFEVIDIAGDTPDKGYSLLYAATYDNGVWLWPLP